MNGHEKNERSARSRSSLFLMEQLIVIAVFALCSAVCVQIFIGSFLMAHGTRDMNRALAAARNAAECYKTYGNPVRAAALLSGQSGHADGAVYYDSEWRVCSAPEAAFVLRFDELDGRDDGAAAASPLLCELSVEKVTGEEILAFTVAARRWPINGGGRDD